MPKVTEEHIEARRRQILAAALACFAREGFHRTTMQDIFREAELSPGAVYSYFKGKDDIIDAITATGVTFATRGAAEWAEASKSGSVTLGEAFERLMRAFDELDVGTVDARTRMAPQLWVEAQRNPLVLDRARTAIGGTIKTFTAIARDAGHRNPEASARLAASLFQGMMVQRSLFGEEVDVEAYIAAGRALLDGES